MENDVKYSGNGSAGASALEHGRRGGLLPQWMSKYSVRPLLLVLLAVLVIFHSRTSWTTTPWSIIHHGDEFTTFEKCSIERMVKRGPSIPSTVAPILLEEFVDRRDRLARALVRDGVDAFIIEPGYTFSYYANITQKDWEPWEPEERPFLMIIRPYHDGLGEVKANTTFLAPKFEEARVRLLRMPFREELSIVTWKEHWDPYRTLAGAGVCLGKPSTVMVDEEMRDFIVRGLSSAGFVTVGLGGEVERVRQTKSVQEVNILRAVNTGTVDALRCMRCCLVPGLSENEVKWALDSTLRAAGLEPFFDIVLFDEDASNPHGGTKGEKLLREDTFVLIDVGAHLYGYSSDVTRTFLPPFSSNDAGTKLKLRKKLKVWDIVYDAQSRSIEQFRENNTAASVDIAARQVIAEAGYGGAFTHRVGHGIGIKAHESPYLNKGNTAALLKAGMTFTTEPGIYLVGEFGVRHEDVFLITEGIAECLSCPRAVNAWTP